MILYFVIAICATTVGALTGMGGGVIIKPVLDLLGNYDAATIGLLSSVTVFAMSVVSIIKQIRQKTRIPGMTALPLAVGSVIGGTGGEQILKALIRALGDNRAVVVTQNICLGLLIILVFVYMLKKDKLPTLHKRGLVLSTLVGVLLGFFSSFLGIGGGPLNVALLIFIFSLDTNGDRLLHYHHPVCANLQIGHGNADDRLCPLRFGHAARHDHRRDYRRLAGRQTQQAAAGENGGNCVQLRAGLCICRLRLQHLPQHMIHNRKKPSYYQIGRLFGL